jgi:hypothetical protein
MSEAWRAVMQNFNYAASLSIQSGQLSYVTVNPTPSAPFSRQLAVAAPLHETDGGPGSTVTLSLGYASPLGLVGGNLTLNYAQPLVNTGGNLTLNGNLSFATIHHESTLPGSYQLLAGNDIVFTTGAGNMTISANVTVPAAPVCTSGFTVRAVAGNFTVNSTDWYITVSTGNVTATGTFPAAAPANSGQFVTVSRTDAGTGNVTWAGVVGSPANLTAQYQSQQFISDGNATWRPV